MASGKKSGCLTAVAIVAGLDILGSCFGNSSASRETASKVGEVTTPNREESSVEENAENPVNSEPVAKISDESSNNSVVEEEPTPELQTEYHVGDILQTKDLKIVYVASGEYISNNEFIQPKEGNKYIFLEFYCENISDTDENISSFSFDCYADGYACDATYFSENELSATLSAGRSTTGRVYFEVPINASEIQVEYEVNMWNSEKVFFAFEGEQNSGFVPEENNAGAKEAFHVGDIVQTKDFNIAYLSCGEYTSDNMFITPKDGYHYIYCELECENISGSDQNVSYFDFDCYADGASCEAFYGMDDALSATISAGRKTKGTVAFEVPLNAQTVEIEFLTNYWTSDRIVFAYQP
ncbi:MAG: DUF4352 domain-containing protein [Oscillospiraceae bacterium]